MELASSLKRMGLQEEEDCASVTFGTVQYFHQESISQTGKEMLQQKFGIQAKAANLDSSTLCNLVLLTNDTTFNSNTSALLSLSSVNNNFALCPNLLITRMMDEIILIAYITLF